MKNQMKSGRKQLSKVMREDAHKAFAILDSTSSGIIDMRDLRIALRALGWESAKDEGRRIIHEIEMSDKGGSIRHRIIDGTNIHDSSRM